jgi:hypothetical protein
MHIAEATELIWIDKISGDRAQTWCDLGCGTGTFTLALATLLSPGSVIHAIDKNEKSLSQIPDRYQEVTIHKESRSPLGSLSVEACSLSRGRSSSKPFCILAAAVSRQSNQRRQNHWQRETTDQESGQYRLANGSQHLTAKQYILGSAVSPITNQARDPRCD